MIKQNKGYFKKLVDKMINLRGCDGKKNQEIDGGVHSIISGAFIDNKITYDDYYDLAIYYTKYKEVTK